MPLPTPSPSQARPTDPAKESQRRHEAQETGRCNGAVSRRFQLTLEQARDRGEVRPASPPRPETREEVAPSPHPGKPRLLLAENEPSLWTFLSQVLGEDYTVEVATDGAQAWEAAQRRTPDLVLSNVRMPEVDGLALTRRLRGHPPTATVPIILLSASNREELLPLGLHAGADEVLAKPFRWSELKKVLSDWSVR